MIDIVVFSIYISFEILKTIQIVRIHRICQEFTVTDNSHIEKVEILL